MQCAECECVSDDAPGWVAFSMRGIDEDSDELEIVSFCPPCASREFRIARTAATDYL